MPEQGTSMIRKIRERLVYENQFIRVYDDDVQFPDGSTGRYVRTRWTAPHGVGVIPIIGDSVLLIRTHRYGAVEPTLEIPQGFGTKAGAVEADARRELLEETGLEAGALEPVAKFGDDFSTYLFLARLAENVEPTAKGQETTESISGYHRLPLANIAVEDFDRLAIRQPVTMFALMFLKATQPRADAGQVP